MNFRNKKNVSLLLLALMLVQFLPPSFLFAHVTSAATIKVQLTSDHMPGFVFCRIPETDLWVGYATITGRVEAKDMGGEPEPTYVKTHVTERDGRTVYTSWADSQSYVHSYTYSSYPSVIGIGTHRITLEIRTKEFTGEVHHTPEWREMHEAAGHEVDRDPKNFYSGEVIRVAAVLSEAPADLVTAELEAVSKAGRTIRKQAALKAAGGRRYEGELHDKSWMSFDDGIREGEYPVVFRVRYRNGTVKETSVPIRIIGNIFKHVSVHRVR